MAKGLPQEDRSKGLLDSEELLKQNFFAHATPTYEASNVDIEIGHAITLDTIYGDFDAYYIHLSESEGVALRPKKYVGFNTTHPFYLRLQSSCVFSESFHSQDCDCSLQLDEAMRLISAHDGLLIYLFQEGRGLGLKGKMQAIYLQQTKGLDTKAAFAELGHPPDVRQNYGQIASVVQQIIGTNFPVTLLTNNPNKVDGLRSANLDVIGVEPLICGLDSITRRQYMAEKQEVLGHIFFKKK